MNCSDSYRDLKYKNFLREQHCEKMPNGKIPNGLSDFIIELTLNQTDEDREKSRTCLQKQYEACDSKLSELVKDNRGNISNTIQLCSKMISTVNDSKNRCRALKERITRCMGLLQCNRDNIRKMWLESLEHQYAHKILSEIEDLRAAPKKAEESLMNKKLEHATDVIVTSAKLLDGNLCNADALKDLRLELHNLQEKLYLIILEDLRKNLHLTDFISEQFKDNLKEVTYEDAFSNKSSRSDFSLKELVKQVNLDQEYISVLLSCVKKMKRLDDTIELLKDNCQMEFSKISLETAKLMNDIIEKSTDSSPLNLPIEKQHVFLIDLVENTLCIFKKILENYKIFFKNHSDIIETDSDSEVEFRIEDVYSKLQAATENFITLYLESNFLFSQEDSFVYESSRNIGDINAFFSPQNLPTESNSSFFKFSNSCHGINIKNYNRDTKTEEIDLAASVKHEKVVKPVLVCKPTVRNITIIFNILKEFITDIETSLNLEESEQCPLYVFLHDSMNLFLDHVNSDINKMMKNAYMNLDAWNTSPVSDLPDSRSSSEKEVLSCSLILNNIMKELENLMTCIPDYSEHFLRLLYYVILDYKDMYHKAFKQMFEEEQSILSISWARDRDIRRLLKSFLNWRHLEDEETVDIIESPEEIRVRNKEESEMLIRILSSEDENVSEMISDTNKLSNLALLQENLIWFSVKLVKFIKKFNQSQTSLQISPVAQADVPENTISSVVTGLRKVIKEYEDFADMCLLALHLEVRARCFHYLLTFSTHEICVESSFIQDLDTAVKSLTSDLLQIEEVLLPILTPKEFKYVFEGLGELVASLMILIVSNMNKINETVVSKIDRNIFIIQCCLANITMAREVSLERARQFIDLLKSTHEEILDQVVEEGPRFNEREYASVFRLISSSATGSPQELEYYLEKLKLIFNRLADSTKEADKISEL